MKKFFALVLALVMAMSLTTVAWGAGKTLTGNETATANNAVAISGNNCEYATVLAADETFDGAGYTYTVTGSDAAKQDVAIYLTGDAVIKDVTIDCAERAIDTDVSAVTSVEINNVVILNSARAIHIQAPADLVVTDSVIAGKVSYLLSGGTATFINCTFVKNGVYEDCIEPWSKTVFINCTFEEGFNVSLEDWNDPSADSTKSVELTDCIYDGELLTADNMDDIFTNTTGVTVENISTATATPGVGTNFYEADASATTKWALVDTFPGATVADFLVEADYDETIPYGNIEYYDVNGVAYVEATKATGAYKLVCGKTEIFLNLAADVDYEFEAESFTGVTTDDEACGKVLVTKKNLTKTYYTATIEVGKVEYTFYFVADKNGTTGLLVGGKIVKAEYVGDDFSDDVDNNFIAHSWVGNDVDATTKAFTTLKCENCGKVAKLYANADAAGKGAVYEQYGWITAADAGYDVVVPSTPSTDKVTSADTFDAGIAMYVGMSVMAAAGSAVVIGKKKD